jgi:superfamily II DNA or RNA helicase
MAAQVRQIIQQEFQPHGYNIGINVGEAAGQTVGHVHLHVIPRYRGDVPDPRGGVRFVIPSRANYLVDPSVIGAPHAEPLITGGGDPLLPHLISHLDAASQVDIAVAFTLPSGVKLLEEHLRDVIKRGGRVRLVTGDYVDCTDPDALLRLLDLGPGLELRFYETAGTSFHLKSYICCEADGRGTAFVGSSNLSQTALLEGGIEWNYRVITSRDGAGFAVVRQAFEALFSDPKAKLVVPALVEAYRRRRSVQRPIEIMPPPETPIAVPEPHPVQQEALRALEKTRLAGNAAGLVVLATGLGKTWLSAFDTARFAAKRVLFVAHREEILDQAVRTFRGIRPHALLGKYTGTSRTVDADVTFASIQTLSRRTHLDRFPADTFDYIIVDEFHHASATTYRRLLDHFTPKFLLGLTATPERTDGADLLALCGENLVYRCDLAEGIRRGLLSPFDYFGVPDEVDYSNIPWRNGQFDIDELTARVAIDSRAQNAFEQLERRGGSRTLAFCVSQRHADFMKVYFHAMGRRVASVHAGPSSDARARSLERLQAGELDVLFAVDMFNEGVDLPDVDTILMLRPTESPVLWLQQFGRGLRYRPDKRLKVIDYIGNHRSFLLKPRTLFELDGSASSTAYALKLVEEGRAAELLPPGCSVTYDLEARDILRELLQRDIRRTDALMAYYTDFRERNGIRPTASEAFSDGYDPRATRQGYGSWFQFVRTMGDLDQNWDAAEVELRTFLQALEVTPLTRSFKMVVLLAMLAEEAFPGSIGIDRLMARVRIMAQRSAVLRTEFGDALHDDAKLAALLEEHPIDAWVEGRGTGGEQYFAFTGGQFSTKVALSGALRESGAALVREIAEWRLAQYVRRTGLTEGAPRIVCRVSHAGSQPILFLPSRDRTPGVPEGWVEVRADGEEYLANFVKVAVNVMHGKGSETNVLGDVLRRWFGRGAGQPGTSHRVVFERVDGGYLMKPDRGEQELGPRVWQRYKRADVPKLFGFEFKAFESQSGVVERPGLMLLFVTLDKASKPEEHRYEDHFESPSRFQWQSQNKTSRESGAGQRIARHAQENIAVHLFVRAAAKVRGRTQDFIYAGPLTFERWDGDRPITVWWKLGQPVPRELREELRVRVG